jgi:hypothetical protein
MSLTVPSGEKSSTEAAPAYPAKTSHETAMQKINTIFLNITFLP